MFYYNSRHQQTEVEIESGNVQENRYNVESLRFELLENGKRTVFGYHNGGLLHEERRKADWEYRRLMELIMLHIPELKEDVLLRGKDSENEEVVEGFKNLKWGLT